MNPVSASATAHEVKSMAHVRKTLNIDWYRCPIDRKVLSQLIRRSDLKGLFQAGGHLGLWCGTASLSYLCFANQLWFGLFVSLFLHGTVTAFFTSPHHELCHRTVFKTPWLNDVFLRVFALLGWLNFRVYRFSHNYHHRYTLFLDGDREEVMPATPSLRILYLIQLFTFNVTGGYHSRGALPTVTSFIRLARNDFSNPFNSWGTELYEGHDKQRAKAMNWARTVLAFHLLVILGSFAAGQPIIALIVSGGTFMGNWLRYFAGVPQHCGLQSNVSDFRKCARTIKLDPVTQFLYWGMNWHLEHHMYAAVPCYNLKKLHRELAGDMPEPRTLLSAWQEMRQTWVRQKVDPDYAFDTPVPSSNGSPVGRNAPDPIVVSVGDLVTRELAE